MTSRAARAASLCLLATALLPATVLAQDTEALDVVDPRIDVHAQWALQRLAQANGATEAIARGLMAAVQQGTLGGIYLEDQQVPALMAQRAGIGWWQIIPSERQAAIYAGAGETPVVVLRRGLANQPRPFDAALGWIWPEVVGLLGVQRKPVVVVQGPYGPPIPLDWCLHWGADCGEPAATAACQAHGLGRAVRWEPQPDVGRTLIMGDGTLCEHAWCDGFASIECELGRMAQADPADAGGQACPGQPSTCGGWFADPQSISIRTAEHVMTHELRRPVPLENSVTCSSASSCRVNYPDGTLVDVLIRGPAGGCGCVSFVAGDVGSPPAALGSYSCTCFDTGAIEFHDWDFL